MCSSDLCGRRKSGPPAEPAGNVRTARRTSDSSTNKQLVIITVIIIIIICLLFVYFLFAIIYIMVNKDYQTTG